MAPIFVPANVSEDWRRLLGEAGGAEPSPAFEALARAWQDAVGLPPEVRALFASSEALPELEPLVALPAHRVPLEAGAAPEPLELWLLARTPEELVSVAVEAGADAALPPHAGRADAGAGERHERVERLCAALGLAAPAPDTALHRLLQRTACALLEARRFHAAHAVLLVHDAEGGDAGFDAFAELVALFGEPSEPGGLVTVGRPGVSLHFAWTRGGPRASG